jgi:hypothetical protein
MRKRARKMGCRRATCHEDEDAGRQQAFETSLEVSALILLCSDSVRVAMLGTCTWYEWCGELMVIRTKMGLGHYEHCMLVSRGVQTPAPVEITWCCKRRVGLSSLKSTNQRCPPCDFGR